MVCPLCGNEMVKGKLFGEKHELKWMPDNKKLILGTWAHNAIVLDDKSSVFGRTYAEAFVCENCKKLIVDI